MGLRLDVVRPAMAVMVPHAALIELIGVLIVFRRLDDALAFKLQDFWLDRAGDRRDDFVLQFEQIGQIAVVSLGHDVMVGVGPDQLGGNPHPTARFAHAAFDDVAHAQFLADLFYIDCLALVVERRVAGDDREGAPAGQHRDDVLGDSIGEEFLLRVAAEIGERQHRDGAAVVEARGARHDSRLGFVEIGWLVLDLGAHPVYANGSPDIL
jgi:hypothetical protein